MFDISQTPVRVATAILLLQAGVYYSMSRTEILPATPPWSEFPTQVANWKMSLEAPLDKETLEKLRPDDYLSRNYTSADGSGLAGLFIGYFNTQRKGVAPHSPKACLPGAGWAPVSSNLLSLSSAGTPPTVPINEFVVEKGSEQLLILYWYLQGGRVFDNEIVAQIYAVPELLFHGRTDIAIVRIIVPIYRGDLQKARETSMKFAQAVHPLVVNHIPN